MVTGNVLSSPGGRSGNRSYHYSRRMLGNFRVANRTLRLSIKAIAPTVMGAPHRLAPVPAIIVPIGINPLLREMVLSTRPRYSSEAWV